MAPELPERLRNEAAFADWDYRRYAHKLKIQPHMFEMYARPTRPWAFREQMAMLLGDVSGKTLLDFGSGAGEEAVYFAKLGAQVTSIDISDVGVEQTRQRAEVNGVRVNFMRGDVLASGLPSHSFDLIHCHGILHHTGWDEGFREVLRLLKPGGRAVIGEHMSNSPMLDRLRFWLDRRFSTIEQSDFERPVKWAEITAWRSRVSHMEMHPYMLAARLNRRSDLLRKLDYHILRLFPRLRHFARGVVVSVTS